MQHRWHEDAAEHEAALAEAVQIAAGEGAQLVCLQELTLSRYFAVTPDGPGAVGATPESLPGGPTHEFASRLARALDRWRRFIPERQQRMREALQQVVGQPKLSADVREVLERALAH